MHVKGLSSIHKKRPQREVIQCGQGGGSYSDADAALFLSQCGHFVGREKDHFFFDFMRTSFMDGPRHKFFRN